MIFIKHKSVGALIDCDDAGAFLFSTTGDEYYWIDTRICLQRIPAGIHIIILYRIEEKNYIHDSRAVCLRPGCYRKASIPPCFRMIYNCREPMKIILNIHYNIYIKYNIIYARTNIILRSGRRRLYDYAII